MFGVPGSVGANRALPGWDHGRPGRRLTVALTWSALDWVSRLTSINPTPTRTANVYAATNQGHIDDILDGWDQIRATR